MHFPMSPKFCEAGLCGLIPPMPSSPDPQEALRLVQEWSRKYYADSLAYAEQVVSALQSMGFSVDIKGNACLPEAGCNGLATLYGTMSANGRVMEISVGRPVAYNSPAEEAEMLAQAFSAYSTPVSGQAATSQPSSQSIPYSAAISAPEGYVVGRPWKIIATGSPGQIVEIEAFHRDRNLGRTAYGTTDSAGYFSMEGRFEDWTVGRWTENVYVGGQLAGAFNFQVQAASSGSQLSFPQFLPPVPNVDTGVTQDQLYRAVSEYKARFPIDEFYRILERNLSADGLRYQLVAELCGSWVPNICGGIHRCYWLSDGQRHMVQCFAPANGGWTGYESDIGSGVRDLLPSYGKPLSEKLVLGPFPNVATLRYPLPPNVVVGETTLVANPVAGAEGQNLWNSQQRYPQHAQLYQRMIQDAQEAARRLGLPVPQPPSGWQPAQAPQAAMPSQSQPASSSSVAQGLSARIDAPQGYVVGRPWKVTVTGPANRPVSVRAWQNGKDLGQTQYGVTSASGVFVLEGVFESGTEGSWVEQWYVGDQVAGTITFSVNSAGAQAQPGEISADAPASGTEKSEDSSVRIETGGIGLSASVPWWVWAAGIGVAVFAISSSGGSRK